MKRDRLSIGITCTHPALQEWLTRKRWDAGSGATKVDQVQLRLLRGHERPSHIKLHHLLSQQGTSLTELYGKKHHLELPILYINSLTLMIFWMLPLITKIDPMPKSQGEKPSRIRPLLFKPIFRRACFKKGNRKSASARLKNLDSMCDCFPHGIRF